MIRQLIALLLVAGLFVGFVPVHATGNYQPLNPQMIFQPTTAVSNVVLTVNNGPAFSHCAGAANCAASQGMIWANPNGMVGPDIIDHVNIQGQYSNAAPPSGNVLIGIFAADTNGKPTSTTPLAVSMTRQLSQAFPASFVQSTFNFTGGNQIAISPNVNYAFAIESMNTTNWTGGSIGGILGSPSGCSGGSGLGTSQYQSGAWASLTYCGNIQVFVDPPTVQGAVSQGSYLYSTMFSFFAVAIMLGLIFNRDHPIVKEYGAKAIVILGLMLVILWTVGLLING